MMAAVKAVIIRSLRKAILTLTLSIPAEVFKATITKETVAKNINSQVLDFIALSLGIPEDRIINIIRIPPIKSM